jgi:hypothetical protein
MHRHPRFQINRTTIHTPHSTHMTQYLRQEADALVETLGFEVAMSETVRLRKYHPRTFIGRGKLIDIRGIVAALGTYARRLAASKARHHKPHALPIQIEDLCVSTHAQTGAATVFINTPFLTVRPVVRALK